MSYPARAEGLGKYGYKQLTWELIRNRGESNAVWPKEGKINPNIYLSCATPNGRVRHKAFFKVGSDAGP